MNQTAQQTIDKLRRLEQETIKARHLDWWRQQVSVLVDSDALAIALHRAFTNDPGCVKHLRGAVNENLSQVFHKYFNGDFPGARDALHYVVDDVMQETTFGAMEDDLGAAPAKSAIAGKPGQSRASPHPRWRPAQTATSAPAWRCRRRPGSTPRASSTSSTRAPSQASAAGCGSRTRASCARPFRTPTRPSSPATG